MFSTFIGGVATPLVVHWPAGISSRGELQHQTSHIIDIAPTCLAAAGANTKAFFDGKTLLPAFKSGRLEPRTLFWEHEGNRAVRSGDFKLVALHNQPWELYDMSRDRSELNDLTETMPGKADELRASYEAWAKEVSVGDWNEVSAKKKKKLAQI